jgi:hypothetical protein
MDVTFGADVDFKEILKWILREIDYNDMAKIN